MATYYLATREDVVRLEVGDDSQAVAVTFKCHVSTVCLLQHRVHDTMKPIVV